MPKDTTDTLSRLYTLLSESLDIHPGITNAILSTREGAVVASVSRVSETDPRLLATVTAATLWAGNNILSKIRATEMEYLLQVTETETVLTVIQSHYCMTFVFEQTRDQLDIPSILSHLRSIVTRVELIMATERGPPVERLIDNLVKNILQITQAILLTQDGLPLSSVGLKNETETAAQIASIFANSRTFSESTSHTIISSQNIDLLIVRIDDNRLLAVICKGNSGMQIIDSVLQVVNSSL